MSDKDNNSEDDSNEFRNRRYNNDLRLIFDKACEITAQFFDISQGWDGSSVTMEARQTLIEAYPELTLQEVAILCSEVARHHRDASKKTGDVED